MVDECTHCVVCQCPTVCDAGHLHDAPGRPGATAGVELVEEQQREVVVAQIVHLILKLVPLLRACQTVLVPVDVKR